MATKPRRMHQPFFLASFAALALLSHEPLVGEDATTATQQSANPETPAVPIVENDYWHEENDDGIVFTQAIKWEEVRYCPYYDVTIQRLGKKDTWSTVREDRVTTPQIEVRLAPGEYRYRLVVYDVLERPALTSEWFPFTVIRALQPKIDDVSPDAVYFEEDNSDFFTVEGDNLLAASTVTFVSTDEGNREYTLTIVESDPDGETLRVTFPIDSIDTGSYALRVDNPGGLSGSSEPVVFKFIKPMDLDVSIGYMPTVVLWDGTIDKYFESSFIPIGVIAKATFIPYKRSFGYFGVGLFASGSRVSNEAEFYDLTMNWAMAHLVFVYQRSLIKNKLMFACHIGPGYTVFHNLEFAFNNGVTSPAFSPSSFSGLAGLSLHYYFKKRMYADLSGDCTYVFMKDMQVFSLHPSLSIGWQF